MDVHGWRNTMAVLEELEKLLLCAVCNKVVSQPCTLGRCEHFFCQQCVNDVKGNVCPVCRVPSHAKDVQRNRQLDTAATVCHQLANLLATSENGAEMDIRVANAEKVVSESALNTSTSASKQHQSNTPEPSPLSRRTRKNTRIKKRKAFIDKTNNDWGIGETAQGTSHDGGKKSTQQVFFKEQDQASAGQSPQSTEEDSRSHRPAAFQKKPDLIADVTKDQMRMLDMQGEGAMRNKVSSAPVTADQVSSHDAITRRSLVNVNGDAASPTLTLRNISSTPVSSGKESGMNCMSTPQSNRSVSINVNTPSSMNKRNAKGETALHVACIKGDVERVRQLLAECATVNTKDNAGWTPLHETCNQGDVVLTELLLDAGALINVPGGPESDTPLHDAVANGHVDCVSLLVARGASITQRNILGKAPMDLAQSDDMKAALQTPVSENCKSKIPQELFPSNDVKHVVIVTTGLNREQKIQVEKSCRSLHGKVISEFTPTVTHVVTTVNKDGMCPRTMKYLHGLLRGRWIINTQWIETSLEHKTWVSEEPFEVPGASSSPNSMAPYRARQNFVQQLPALFTGCHFYLQGNFTYPAPSKSELTDLIKAGGGQILNREPRTDVIEQSSPIVPYHSTAGSKLENCSHYIVRDKLKQGQLFGPRLAVTSPAWVMDCIAYFKILDLPG